MQGCKQTCENIVVYGGKLPEKCFSCFNWFPGEFNFCFAVWYSNPKIIYRVTQTLIHIHYCLWIVIAGNLFGIVLCTYNFLFRHFLSLYEKMKFRTFFFSIFRQCCKKFHSACVMHVFSGFYFCIIIKYLWIITSKLKGEDSDIYFCYTYVYFHVFCWHIKKMVVIFKERWLLKNNHDYGNIKSTALAYFLINKLLL